MNTLFPGCVVRALAITAVAPALLGAQQNDSTSQARRAGPPIHRIASASAVSTERLRAVATVRELSDGRVLVNDVLARRVLLMDSTMRTVAVVLDSTSEKATTYGPRPGALLPYRADTTFFIDPASYAILVLDADGRIVRTRSVWRAQDAMYFANPGGPVAQAGPDAKGRIVYRIAARPAPPRVRPPAGVPYFPEDPDSAFVVAANLDTRKLDTLGVIRTPRNELRVRVNADRGFSIAPVVNPLPSTDEWAVLPDGTVAFVRGRDYRIEYLHPDGTVTSSAKLPFDWQRLTDEDKQQLVDSVKAAQQKVAANEFITSMIRWVNQYGRGYPKGFTVPEGYVLGPGLPKDYSLPPGVTFPPNYIYACAPGVDPFAGGAAPGPVVMSQRIEGGAGGVNMSGSVRTEARPGQMVMGGPGGSPACLPAPVMFSSGGTPPPPTPRAIQVIEPAALPDYRPPFPAGSVRADQEGNLWIRTNPMKPTPDGAVFDVVSASGDLVDRIQLPLGYAIVGFGKGKVVYLSMRDATGIHVARVRLK
ncbi:MAG TPA: hypothetical protein VF021_05020 [Longimicrobiales bacterium]